MVALVGLGNMGGGMLARLVALGEQPRCYDADAGKRQAAAATGGIAAATLAEAADALVILSLPDDAVVAAVLRDLLPALPAGAVVIDTSTLAPDAARGFAQQAAACGCAYLDAPVSGGAAGAQAGTLAMMVGGDAAALDRARPVLDKLATRLVHVGASGAGQVAKLVNNLLVATHLVTAAEALRVARRAGLEPAALLPILNGATGRSAATEINFPRWIESGSFDSGFTAGLMRKDVRLALAMVESLDEYLPACEAAAGAWLDGSIGTVADGDDFNRLPALLARPDFSDMLGDQPDAEED